MSIDDNKAEESGKFCAEGQEIVIEEPQEVREEQMKQEDQTQMHEEVPTEVQRIAELEAQLAQARQEASENWNKFLRERADMENFRKRQDRISSERIAREKKSLIHKMLEVMDNVERAQIYQESMDKQALLHTLRMLLWQLNEVLRGEGLTPVPTMGEVFDPYIHEAIDAVEDSDQPEGTIVEEVLKGYKMGDEILRPARVKVSAGSKNRQG